MLKEKIVYMEFYRSNKIKIYGQRRDWFWIVVNRRRDVVNKNIYSAQSYYSLESAISNAKKHIDREAY